MRLSSNVKPFSLKALPGQFYHRKIHGGKSWYHPDRLCHTQSCMVEVDRTDHRLVLQQTLVVVEFVQFEQLGAVVVGEELFDHRRLDSAIEMSLRLELEAVLAFRLRKSQLMLKSNVVRIEQKSEYDDVFMV